MTTPKIIFEDASILVLEKPEGWIVNRAETVAAENTLQNWVEKYLGYFRRKMSNVKCQMSNDFWRRSGIVHRLDKETSGLLLVAKTVAAFNNLQRQFKERKVTKRYLALVHGRVEPTEGEISAAISRNPFNRKKFGVFLGGRPAVTKYKTISNFHPPAGGPISNKKFTLLEISPETGRTHQIRVHLKHLGHPLVGDEIYAGRKTARDDRQWCPRQFLHASYLAFFHPETGKKLEFISSLPADLEAVMKKL